MERGALHGLCSAGAVAAKKNSAIVRKKRVVGSAWAQAAASVPTIAKSAVTLERDDKSTTEITATEYPALHFLLHMNIMNNILMEEKLNINRPSRRC
jgi:hypothetical protein